MSNEEISELYKLLREYGKQLAAVEKQVAVLTVQLGEIVGDLQTGRARMWAIFEKLVILGAGASVGHFLGG